MHPKIAVLFKASWMKVASVASVPEREVSEQGNQPAPSFLASQSSPTNVVIVVIALGYGSPRDLLTFAIKSPTCTSRLPSYAWTLSPD